MSVLTDTTDTTPQEDPIADPATQPRYSGPPVHLEAEDYREAARLRSALRAIIAQLETDQELDWDFYTGWALPHLVTADNRATIQPFGMFDIRRKCWTQLIAFLATKTRDADEWRHFYGQAVESFPALWVLDTEAREGSDRESTEVMAVLYFSSLLERNRRAA